MKTNGTKNKIIRSEFNSFVRASFKKSRADEIIKQAKKNGYDENYCFDIYSEGM